MNTAIIPLQQAIVLRGQRAWGRIKSTAAEQRQLWREVGEALNYGRALHPSNQAFGAWCKEEGFDMKPNHRSNAMWLAANWVTVLTSCQDASLTHPTAIREAHRDSQAPAPLATPADEDKLQATANAILKAGKVRSIKAAVAHSERTGPEADIARKQVAKTAEAFGVTPDALTDIVNKMDPHSQMPPQLRQGLNETMAYIREFTKGLRILVDNSQGVVTPTYLLAYINAELTA